MANFKIPPPLPPPPTDFPVPVDIINVYMLIRKIVLCAVLQLVLKNKDYCFQNLVLKEITQKGRGCVQFNTANNKLAKYVCMDHLI